jgi:hypothetical protein
MDGVLSENWAYQGMETAEDIEKGGMRARLQNFKN